MSCWPPESTAPSAARAPSTRPAACTVETTYNADGNILTLTAKNSTTGDQVTSYVYGTAMGGITPEIYRNDLLRAEIYPDSDDTTTLGDGADGVYDRVEYKYNREGERIWKKDQNGTVHEYQFDPLGRDMADKVTSVGTGVDNSVLRIAKTYEVRGMVDTITSYDAATAGSAVNEAVFEYDDSELLSKEYQEHEGAKDANTLYVQYNRDTSASGGEFTKALRPTSVRYPNGRLVHNTYGSAGSIGDALNRLDAIKDDNAGSPGNSLAEYSYLGSGTIVIEDFPQPDVKLNYASGAAGAYAGFDRFGRVVDQLWYDYGASADRDRYTYGYDRASNRLYRENTIASTKDEFYSYDGVNRLTTVDRGDLNGGKTAISGTPVWEEDWSLDPTGNWTDYVQKTSGSTDLDQDRTQNKVNETTAITSTTDTNWADPVHDKAGNMTTVPKPSSLANGLTCKYDAWNRLVEVKDGATVVGRYEYDGRNRRVKRHLDSQSPASPDGLDTYVHYFYNDQWQILETRQTTTESDQPESLQPKYQHVWSPRYVDSPILRDENTDADSLCDDQRLYYLTDANFNVTSLINTAGDAVEHYLYNPYGKPTIYDGNWSTTRSTSTYNNVLLYAGRELDPESGLMHYRNRYYSTELGRFVSRDPIGHESQDVNLYRYVSNSPLNLLDASGLDSRSGALWVAEPVGMPYFDPHAPGKCIAGCHGRPGPGPSYGGPPLMPPGGTLTEIVMCGLVMDVTVPEGTDLAAPIKVPGWVCAIVVAIIIDECTKPKLPKTEPPKKPKPQKGCKPCPPAKITVDRSPPSRRHSPCPGDHWHIRFYNQLPYPSCKCILGNRQLGGCLPQGGNPPKVPWP